MIIIRLFVVILSRYPVYIHIWTDHAFVWSKYNLVFYIPNLRLFLNKLYFFEILKETYVKSIKFMFYIVMQLVMLMDYFIVNIFQKFQKFLIYLIIILLYIDLGPIPNLQLISFEIKICSARLRKFRPNNVSPKDLIKLVFR